MIKGAGKRGAIGEGILMIYRLIMVMFIALVILGISSVFYSHYINVRDTEAVIMARQVVDCLTLTNSDIYSIEKNRLLAFCGYDDYETNRFFVRVTFTNDSGKQVHILSQGDSGALWVKELFEKQEKKIESVKKYVPGYFKEDYLFFDSINNKELNMKVEILVNAEF